MTGNNITNTDTPGYTRQQAMQVSKNSQQLGATYLGSGASITDVRRIYSGYLTTQVRTATALDSDAQTYLTQISQVNSLLADSTTGITAVMENFFAALQTAAASPTDTASRQLLLTQASTLGERFNSIYSQLAEQKLVTQQEAEIMRAAISAQAVSIPIPDALKDAVRARTLKSMLIAIARQNRTQERTILPAVRDYREPNRVPQRKE